MNIYVNSKLQELNPNATIHDALSALNIASPKGIAIAINNNVVSKEDWANHILKEDDRLTLIKATQGG